MTMSGLIIGTHLSRVDLEHPVETKRELKYLSDILESTPYEDTASAAMRMSVSKDVAVKQQVKKVMMRGLGYGDHELSQIEYEIFHIVSKVHISFGRDDLYLVPIRIGPDALHISDPSTAPVAVSVGQRVFFNRPVIIEPGIVVIIRTKRKQEEGGKEEQERTEIQ